MITAEDATPTAAEDATPATAEDAAQQSRQRTLPQQQLRVTPQHGRGRHPNTISRRRHLSNSWKHHIREAFPAKPTGNVTLTATSPAKTAERVASTATLPDTSGCLGFLQKNFCWRAGRILPISSKPSATPVGTDPRPGLGSKPGVVHSSFDRLDRHPVVPLAFNGQTCRLINLLTAQWWVRLFIRSPPVVSGVRWVQGKCRFAPSVGGSRTTTTRVSGSTCITDPGG